MGRRRSLQEIIPFNGPDSTGISRWPSALHEFLETIRKVIGSNLDRAWSPSPYNLDSSPVFLPPSFFHFCCLIANNSPFYPTNPTNGLWFAKRAENKGFSPLEAVELPTRQYPTPCSIAPTKFSGGGWFVGSCRVMSDSKPDTGFLKNRPFFRHLHHFRCGLSGCRVKSGISHQAFFQSTPPLRIKPDGVEIDTKLPKAASRAHSVAQFRLVCLTQNRWIVPHFVHRSTHNGSVPMILIAPPNTEAPLY